MRARCLPSGANEGTENRMTTPVAEPASPAAAASVVILRDAGSGGGLEVFMMERHQGSGQTFAGAFVFPGGKVDAEDAASDWQDLAPTAAPHPAHPFWVAAVRETFEETGLLFARQGSGGLIGAEAAYRLVAAERGADRKQRAGRFLAMVRREGLTLAADEMVHFGHWITPTWVPKRFDTHFFLAAAPLAQRANLDRRESAEGVWISPAEALREAEAGKRTLVAVTRCTLELLATWRSVGEAMAAARRRRIVPVQPVMEERAGAKVLRIPIEAGYPRSELPVLR